MECLFSSMVFRITHAGDKKDKCYTSGKEDALTKRYIALNDNYYLRAITIDVDRTFDGEEFYEKTYEEGVPMPNYGVISPETEHYHLIYLLPCLINRNGRKPEQAYKFVQRNLTTAWGGDRNYSNHLMKNPLHPSWITYELRKEGYSLQELILWAEKQEFEEKPVTNSEYEEDITSRNCTLFNLTREYAVFLYKAGKLTYDALYDFAFDHNNCGYTTTTIKEPLSTSEVKSTVKSIFKFMKTRYTGKGGGKYTKENRRKSMEKRRAKMWGRINRFIEYRKMKLSLKEISRILGITVKTLYHYLKLIRSSFNNIRNFITDTSALLKHLSDTKVNEDAWDYGESAWIIPDTS